MAMPSKFPRQFLTLDTQLHENCLYPRNNHPCLAPWVMFESIDPVCVAEPLPAQKIAHTEPKASMTYDEDPEEQVRATRLDLVSCSKSECASMNCAKGFVHCIPKLKQTILMLLQDILAWHVTWRRVSFGLARAGNQCV